MRLPVVPSAFTAKNGASLRQGLVKRSCSTRLSYGPPVLGPAGFEPATTSLRGCSSTCIRNATSKQTRQGTARRLASAGYPASGVRSPKAPCSPACIRVKPFIPFKYSRVATRNPVKPWRLERCSSTRHSPLDNTHQVGATCDQIRKSCRPVSWLRACRPARPYGAVLLRAFACGTFLTSLPSYCAANETFSISLTQCSDPVLPSANVAISVNTASENPPTFMMSRRSAACVVPYG